MLQERLDASSSDMDADMSILADESLMKLEETEVHQVMWVPSGPFHTTYVKCKLHS